MSSPHSRLGEARKQIRLAAEELAEFEELQDVEDVEDLDDAVENLEEAARLVETVRDDLVDRDDDPLTDT